MRENVTRDKENMRHVTMREHVRLTFPLEDSGTDGRRGVAAGWAL